jgi:hypothetical protein
MIKKNNIRKNKKKVQSLLEKQTEIDMSCSMTLGLPHALSSEYYLPIAQNHAQSINKDNNGELRRKEAWKQINEVIPKCEWYLGCNEKPTKIVSHEVERFYGKKHLEACYCTTHAKATVKRLKEGDQRLAVKFDFEPIEVRDI